MPDNVDKAPEEHTAVVKTILVVEDDTAVGEFLIQVLQSETPFQPILATDGFQALKIVEGLKPNLFLLDYQLPGMNGLDLYDRLHSQHDLEAIPALFMSANFPQGKIRQHQVYLINKPFELDELLQLILEILETE